MKTDAERSVLFVNRVHPPAPGATGELLQQLAATLAASGWRVTVVAARPAGVTARGETRDGVRFEWVGGLPFTRASHARRALSYLSLYPALLGRLWRVPRHGTVVMLTDPPLQFVLGLLVRPFKRCRLVHWAQDVYPEVAEELGVIRQGGVLAGLLRGVANFALRRFDRVIAVGACMKQRLVARGLAAEKITVIPNWADPREVRPVARGANAFLQEQGMTERFVVMYSGNFGLAHQFEPILDAAELLAAGAPRVAFLLVGDGPRAAWIQGEVARRNLENVRVLPPTPRARLAESLGAADVHLVSMRAELCGLVVPSKVYGVLAAG
ncbi:MAG: glycosyltransferase family 4 protein, partial [Verrucomicrobia bacterium]|nr:glycosyltransferase family 4 protein [Verrucomicrobiota bacterium]